MVHQSVINGWLRLSTTSVITDKTWDCISHIQGTSSLFDGNERATPLHPTPPDWRYQITSIESLPHRGHWRTVTSWFVQSVRHDNTKRDYGLFRPPRHWEEELDYGSDVESKVSTPMRDDMSRQAPNPFPECSAAHDTRYVVDNHHEPLDEEQERVVQQQESVSADLRSWRH